MVTRKANVGNQMSVLPYRWPTHIKLMSDGNFHSGKEPQSRFFCMVKGGAEVSFEPAGSQWPSAHNHLHVKMTIFFFFFLNDRLEHQVLTPLHLSPHLCPVSCLLYPWMSHNTWKNEMCSEFNGYLSPSIQSSGLSQSLSIVLDQIGSDSPLPIYLAPR